MAKKTTEEHIAAIITERLRNHQSIQVKGLGTFTVTHRRQDHRQEKDGRILLLPPADVVTFVAENGGKL